MSDELPQGWATTTSAKSLSFAWHSRAQAPNTRNTFNGLSILSKANLDPSAELRLSRPDAGSSEGHAKFQRSSRPKRRRSDWQWTAATGRVNGRSMLAFIQRFVNELHHAADDNSLTASSLIFWLNGHRTRFEERQRGSVTSAHCHHAMCRNSRFPLPPLARAAADCGEAGDAVGQSGRLPAAADEDSRPAQTLSPIRPRRRLLRPPHRRLAGGESTITPLRRAAG